MQTTRTQRRLEREKLAREKILNTTISLLPLMIKVLPTLISLFFS